MSTQIDIREEMTHILRLVGAWDHAYGENYLIRLLRGDGAFGWCKPEHEQLPGFGELADSSAEKVRSLINLLVNRNFLRVTEQVVGKLTIDQAGIDYLTRPMNYLVTTGSLKVSTREKLLTIALQQLRRELSRQEGLPPFRIFTDYMLQNLVRQMPLSVLQLKTVSGFSDSLADRYGVSILGVIRKVHLQLREEEAHRLHVWVQTPACQSVRSLFMAGESPEAIALRRKVKPETVFRILEALHITGHIDFRSWVKTQVPDAVRQKACAYFSQNPESSLKAALNELGLDYQTLRWCRILCSPPKNQTNGQSGDVLDSFRSFHSVVHPVLST